MVVLATNEIADFARLVGIRLGEVYENPEQRASPLDRPEARWPHTRMLFVYFYRVEDLVATTSTPTSLSGRLTWLPSLRHEQKLPYTFTQLHHVAYLQWKSPPDEPLTQFAEDVVVHGHGRTQPTIERQRAALAVEGELSAVELFREVLAKARATTTPRPSKAFHAFTELRRWLRLTASEAADLIGVKRTTPNAWQREGREPRPASARRLYQLHAIVSALVRKLGEYEAIRWLETGDPSPREQLLHGEVGAVSRAAEALVIGPQPLPGPPPGALIEEPEGEAVPFVPRIRRRRRHRGGSNDS